VFHSQHIEGEIERQIIAKVTKEVTTGLGAIHAETHDPASDPETTHPSWFSYRIGQTLFDQDACSRATCENVAEMSFPRALEAARRILTKAGLDPDKILEEFNEPSL
jgi:hypothetical protein